MENTNSKIQYPTGHEWPNDYYVYIMFDQGHHGPHHYGRDGKVLTFDIKPFYVGMGRGTRPDDHFKEAKTYEGNKNHKVNKIRQVWRDRKECAEVRFVFEGLTRDDAFNKEMELIHTIGRDNNHKAGPLTNIHPGGKLDTVSNSIYLNTDTPVVPTVDDSVLFYIDDVPYSCYHVAATAQGCTYNTVKNRIGYSQPKWSAWVAAEDYTPVVEKQSPLDVEPIVVEDPIPASNNILSVSSIAKHMEELIIDGITSRNAILKNTMRLTRGNSSMILSLLDIVHSSMVFEYGQLKD